MEPVTSLALKTFLQRPYQLVPLLMVLYRNLVMGFDRENHAREAHQAKNVTWKKMN